MITSDIMLFIISIVSITAGGTHYLFTKKAYERGLSTGFNYAVLELVRDGFLESEIDKDGDDSLVSIREIKRRCREQYNS